MNTLDQLAKTADRAARYMLVCGQPFGCYGVWLTLRAAEALEVDFFCRLVPTWTFRCPDGSIYVICLAESDDPDLLPVGAIHGQRASVMERIPLPGVDGISFHRSYNPSQMALARMPSPWLAGLPRAAGVTPLRVKRDPVLKKRQRGTPLGVGHPLYKKRKK
jgi:hypothetical protein